jgi:hypothetical protein
MRCGYLALGLAAALVILSPAHAEDAIVPDEFEQPRAVGACDGYGAGFAQLPGTKTCVRVSGQVRFEKHFSSRGGATGGQTRLEFETRSD